MNAAVNANPQCVSVVKIIYLQPVIVDSTHLKHLKNSFFLLFLIEISKIRAGMSQFSPIDPANVVATASAALTEFRRRRSATAAAATPNAAPSGTPVPADANAPLAVEAETMPAKPSQTLSVLSEWLRRREPVLKENCTIN